MKRKVSIIDAMNEPTLFGRWFSGDSWQSWRAFLKALFAVAMTETDRAIFGKCTGRSLAPSEALREGWLVVGRRGGKSLIAAFIGVFLACFRDYTGCFAPGERGTVMIIAADRRQARTVMRYVTAFLETSMLARMVCNRTQETIDLTNRISIEIHTCSFRAVRGYTIVAAVCDEIAFWKSEDSANPDVEVIAALRPALATIPGSLLLCISSPYARRGALWQAYTKHYGKDGDSILVWQADTLSMNPSIDPSIIEQAFVEDESGASAEYGAQFRRDIETFVSREAVEACVIPGRFELPPVSDVRYLAFLDPSGGSSDSFTFAIAHREKDRAILDLVREVKPPFSPESVCKEFADDMKRYHVSSAHSDRYAGEWPREQFSKHGVSVIPSERTKPEIYLELLPALNSGKVELVENPRLISQLLQLERKTARGGKDSVDHPPGGHDDLINSAAGALLLALQQGRGLGLLEWYKEQADLVRQQQRGIVPTPPITTSTNPEPVTPEESGKAQVDALADLRFTRRDQAGKPLPPPKPPKTCPDCGSKVAEYSDSWKCFSCGASGPNEQKPEVYTSSVGEVVP